MRIEQLRNKVDDLDEQLLSLINERARLALQIGQLKQKQNIEIVNIDREKQVLDRLAGLSEGPLAEKHVRTIFGNIVSACRDLQLYEEEH